MKTISVSEHESALWEMYLAIMSRPNSDNHSPKHAMQLAYEAVEVYLEHTNKWTSPYVERPDENPTAVDDT